MSGGGKGGSTTVNKVEIPPEVLARYNAVNARAEDVAKQPYQQYSSDPNAFVAPLTGTQQAGIQNTNIMAGAAQPYYQSATGLVGASTAAVNPDQLNINQYMNPYTQNVVNATQAALQQQQGQQLAQQQADAIRGGAFGGDRAGLQRAILQGQQGLATAQAISPLYQQNYNQALAAAQQQQGVNLAAQQANRANLQNAANLFGQIGTNAQQAGLAGAQAQMAAGQTEQQTQQAGLQALYNQFQQKQGYPFQVAQFLANIAEGTGALSGNQTTQTTTGGGGFFSDRRLKENVQKIGETNDGQPIYRYNYKGDDRTQIGLMAQDVEKNHPDAVGLAGGYKTVDYKRATDDAVHKADGGSATDSYSMGAPSSMLQGGGNLGAIQLPKMITGSGIHVQPSAINPEAAGLLSPKAIGFSPGTLAGARAEKASLESSLASGNGADIGSGPQYLHSRLDELNNFLNQNSSQGGLVGPQGGEFARGGFAFGGVPDYSNPALAYYGPQAAGGLYGVQLQPGGQRQLMQGAQIQRPAERNAMAELSQTAALGKNAADLWGKRPDFLRSKEDVESRELARQAVDAKNKSLIDKYSKDNEDTEDEEDDGNARGGLIGREHHSTGSYVNPKAGLYGGGSYMDDILQDQSQQPQYHLMKGGEMLRQPQQQSGLGSAMQAVSLGKTGKSAYDWASKQLAGKAPLGETAPVAEGAKGAVETATAPSGGVIDLTTKAPGLGTAAAPETVAAAAPEAVAAAAPEAIAGAAPEALSAGLAGGAEAAAPIMTAAAGEGIADLAPLFFFLKNGGAVPHRRHYQTAGGVPVIVPDDYVTDSDFMPPPAPEPSTRGDRAVRPGLGNVPNRETQTITVAPRVGLPDAVPAPRSAPPKRIKEAQEPASKPFIPSLDRIGSAAKDALSSEDFWVPALTGIGSMLASPNKTLLGAIGSGLVGGAGAYGEMQKLGNQQMKQRLDALKGRFIGPTLVDGRMVYRDTWTGENVDQSEYGARVSQHITGKTPGAPSPAAAALDTARDVVRSEAPKMQPAKVIAPQAPQTVAQKTGEETSTAAPATTVSRPSIPPAEAPTAPAAPAEGQRNLINIDQEMINNDALWQSLPESLRPKRLLGDAAAMDAKIRKLERDRDMIESSVGETNQSKSISAEIASLRTERQNKISLAQQQIDRASKLAQDQASADIRRGSAVQEESDKIDLLPKKQQIELQGEIAKKGALNPIDLQQKQAEADIQRDREVRTAREKLPTEEAKSAFDAAVKRQDSALQKAAAEAKEAQVARSQAQAALSVMFDKNGKPMISSGPLGPKIANVASYMSQLGFSDRFIQDLTKTNPNNAQALEKLQTAMTAEIARLELAGSPVRVSEFQQFLRSTPGATLLPNAFKWIVENTIIPKAQASIDAYKSVKDLTPGVHNIEGELFDYYDKNPWFKGSPTNIGETSAPPVSLPPPTPENMRSALEEKQKRESLRRNP